MMGVPLSRDEQGLFALVATAADDLGMESYVIGGFIRDKLLQRPSTDIDIVCVGDGIALAKQVARMFNPPLKVAVFKTFGTAKLIPGKKEKIPGDYDIEFVGARKESYSRNSRNPVVASGTLEDDLNRRDFTINTMALSLKKDRIGEMLDVFGGLEDLKNGIIRTPLEPDKAFSDDPLRMMRAIRFSAQLGFKIEPKTYDAISFNKSRIRIVSQERITEELNKIISSPAPSVGFKMLFSTGILRIIFPEMAALQGVEFINNTGHKDNFYHTLKVLDNVAAKSNDLWLRWAAILHDIAKPVTKRFEKKAGWTFHGHEVVGERMVPEIFRRFRLPLNEKMKFVQKIVLLHLRPISLTSEVVTDSGVRRLLFEAGDDIESLMTLAEADITSRDEIKVKRFLNNFKLVRSKLVEVEEKDKIRNWQPPVTGEMIMETFGIKPSPVVGILKNEIKNAILDGGIRNDFKEAFAFMIERGKLLGLSPVKSGKKSRSKSSSRK